MSRIRENQGFVCINCSKKVLPIAKGSYRNHCPFCLFSLHVDELPGDRASRCRGLMEPIRIIYNSKKGYQLVHKCIKCGIEKANIISDDISQPDDFNLILKIMSNIK